MDHFNLSRYFEVIAGTDFNGPKVTKSQVIEEALERMSLSDHRDQVIMVGDIKHNLIGTEFQKHVWQSLMCIPYGHTISYSEDIDKDGKIEWISEGGKSNVYVDYHGKSVEVGYGPNVYEWTLATHGFRSLYATSISHSSCQLRTCSQSQVVVL